MAPTIAGDTSSRLSKRTVQPIVRFSTANAPFKLDKGLLAKRSAKIAALLEENPHEDLTAFFRNIKADVETLELVARFCHGFEVYMSNDNIVPLICLSHTLKMTETHSPDNLLDKALLFLEKRILPSWDEIIRSLRASSTHVLDQAIAIGLFDSYITALTTHALANPSLLAQSTFFEPNNKPVNGTRRKLFGADHSTIIYSPSEDLTSLPLRVYEPIMAAMAQQQVPQDYITASLFQYLKNHQSDREVIEAVERLLPSENHISTPLLLELYIMLVSLGASPECITGLEIRIGKQLDQITLKDLLALDLGVENLKHILKGFYGNYSANNNTGLVVVAELMEQYLIEIANETDLEASIFTEIAEMASSTSSLGGYRFTDGIYRAVDIYLDKHRELTELEKEKICRVLDFEKMSKEACDHVTQNQRLPLRVVVQALFNSQCKLRDEICKAVGTNCNNSNHNVEEEGGGGEIKVVEDDERREIMERGHEMSCCGRSSGRKKGSLWKEVKRKFGCMSSNNYQSLCDCNCQVKKRKKFHPK